METRTLLFPVAKHIGPGSHTAKIRVETRTESWMFGELVETVDVKEETVIINVPEPPQGDRRWFWNEDLFGPASEEEERFLVIRDDDEKFWGEGGKPAFLDRIVRENRENIKHLADFHGWGLDEHGLPLPPIQTFSKAAFEAENKKLMAHVLVEVGIFKSVGEAKRNGWDKPIETGEFCLTKRKVRFKVVN
jgi:hypothetical protein